MVQSFGMIIGIFTYPVQVKLFFFCTLILLLIPGNQAVPHISFLLTSYGDSFAVAIPLREFLGGMGIRDTDG